MSSISGPLVVLLRLPLTVVITLATVVVSEVRLSRGDLPGMAGDLGTHFCTVPTCWKHACTMFSGNMFLDMTHKRDAIAHEY